MGLEGLRLPNRETSDRLDLTSTNVMAIGLRGGILGYGKIGARKRSRWVVVGPTFSRLLTQFGFHGCHRKYRGAWDWWQV